MYAIGGLIACLTAAFIELKDNQNLDPNIFFGIYASFIIILLIVSIFLNRDLEPEVILE
jgi:hypothetical protein